MQCGFSQRFGLDARRKYNNICFWASIFLVWIIFDISIEKEQKKEPTIFIFILPSQFLFKELKEELLRFEVSTPLALRVTGGEQTIMSTTDIATLRLH